jgi:hypothetical protein
MFCNEIDLRRSFFLNANEILKSVLNKNEDCDDEDNWSKSSFNSDFVESSRDLKTKNSLNVRYFSIDIQNSLHASRNVVLSTTHFERYSNDSTKTTRMTRDLILTENDRICDLIFVMIIIWIVCKNSLIKISRTNLCSASQNWFNSKVWMMIFSFKWIMKTLWTVRTNEKRVNS